ncbi:MAG: hypothetical protein PF689_06205 [Deltaproteobacteria bacterium]|jgi:hypothetical protein|nr:hypothetical protein [Deltaproteobacteria bacterium]
MSKEKIKTTSNLLTTLFNKLPPPKDNLKLLFLGNGKIGRKLVLKGYKPTFQLTDPINDKFDLVVAMDTLPANTHKTSVWFSRLASQLESGGRLLVIEQSTSLSGARSWWGKLAAKAGFISLSESLSTLYLKNGFTQIKQSWPQGLRSLVLCEGTLNPSAALLEKLNPMKDDNNEKQQTKNDF